MAEEGIGECLRFRLEGASEEEELVVYDMMELASLCYAGGGRWVVVHGENLDYIWHGPTPERALAAYLGERLEYGEESLESEREYCEDTLRRAQRRREAGDLEEAESLERQYRYCLKELEKLEERVRLTKSAYEGLRSGRIRVVPVE
jgi:hypothetical protein